MVHFAAALYNAERARLGPASKVFADVPVAAIDEMSAGIAERELADLRSAGHIIAAKPNGPFSKREGWFKWMCACASVAVNSPHLEVEAERAFHEVSGAAGGDTTQNAEQWESTLASTARKLGQGGGDLIGLGTIFHMAEELHEATDKEPPEPQGESLAAASAIHPDAVFGADSGPAPPGMGNARNYADCDFLNLTETLEPRQWLAGTELIKGEITVLASPGGKGKSSFAICLMASVASAKSLIGVHVFGHPRPQQRGEGGIVRGVEDDFCAEVARGGGGDVRDMVERRPESKLPTVENADH